MTASAPSCGGGCNDPISGEIDVSPPDAACEAFAGLTTCTFTYPLGTVVTLVAGSGGGGLGTFTWSGACSGVVGDTCSLTMDTDKAARANFH